MISVITGTLIEKKSTELVVSCSGVGFQIFTSVISSEQFQELGSVITLHTALIHREDAMQLFGFSTKIEKDVFKLLTSVSGIGPKSAIAILSSISVIELKNAIASENILLMTKMPGVGKKTAERLIIELKDKIIKLDIDSDYVDLNLVHSDSTQDAISAMIALGYNRQIAEKSVKRALQTAKNTEINIEDLIRIALKFALN